jgi:hypothetical protein
MPKSIDNNFKAIVKSGALKGGGAVRRLVVQDNFGTYTIQALEYNQTSDPGEAYRMILAYANKGYDLPRSNILGQLQRKAGIGQNGQQAPKPKPQPPQRVTVQSRGGGGLFNLGRRSAPAKRKTTKALVKVDIQGHSNYQISVPGSPYPETYRDAESALARLNALIRLGYAVDRQTYSSLRLRTTLPGGEAGGIRRTKLR